MDKAYFIQNSKTNINSDLEIKKDFDLSNTLIQKINNVHFNGVISYLKDLDTVSVNGTLDFSVETLDVIDGQTFEYSDSLEWNEEYCFLNQEKSGIENYIIGDDFDLFEYSFEQIVLNIPINISKNYGKISSDNDGDVFYSEESFAKSKENQVDPRWEKLINLGKDIKDTKKEG